MKLWRSISKNKRNKTTKIFVLLIFLLIFFSCEKKDVIIIKEFFLPKYNVSQNMLTIDNLIIKDLVEQGSISTNYSINDKEIIGNKIILSETQGLIMEYAVYTKNKDIFDKSFNYLKEKMSLENGLYSWEYNESTNKKNETSATIDDLRILKSLVYANSLWGGYEPYIKSLVIGLKKVKKDNYLTDFVDPSGISKEVSLFYIDVVAMDMLSQMNDNYKKIQENSLKLLKKSRINKSTPFTYEIYSVKKEKFQKLKKINTLNYLIITYNKKLAGISIKEDLEFLKKVYIRDGGIYSQYDLSGKPLNNIKSTAIYAYLKIILLKEKDYEFIKKIDKEMAVLLNGEELPVSYGEKKLYSFDLLVSLLSKLEVE